MTAQLDIDLGFDMKALKKELWNDLRSDVDTVICDNIEHNIVPIDIIYYWDYRSLKIFAYVEERISDIICNDIE